MLNSSCRNTMFILYDGIENSVFESQVLQPLLNQIKQNINLHITLVSFEKKRPPTDIILKIIPAHERLHFVLCRRLPFLGKLTLVFATFQLKKLLTLIPSNHVIARGPLAGTVALSALKKFAQKHQEQLSLNNPEKLPTLTIQARGLCAEEYRYSIQNKDINPLKTLFQKYLYHSQQNIETNIYGEIRTNTYPRNIVTEAVSPALKDYLISKFHANPTKIIIATKDLPKSIPTQQVARWREEIRTELNIANDALVYCYSGSFKVWQCAHETIAAFSYEYSRNQKCFMLILTKDQEPFQKELTRYKIPTTNFCIKTVRSNELYRYLAAGDYGMLLRERDIINWVSRPTKMLEYQAVGLKIIHNNTVGWLANK